MKCAKCLDALAFTRTHPRQHFVNHNAGPEEQPQIKSRRLSAYGKSPRHWSVHLPSLGTSDKKHRMQFRVGNTFPLSTRPFLLDFFCHTVCIDVDSMCAVVRHLRPLTLKWLLRRPYRNWHCGHGARTCNSACTRMAERVASILVSVRSQVRHTKRYAKSSKPYLYVSSRVSFEGLQVT